MKHKKILALLMFAIILFVSAHLVTSTDTEPTNYYGKHVDNNGSAIESITHSDSSPDMTLRPNRTYGWNTARVGIDPPDTTKFREIIPLTPYMKRALRID